MGCVLFGVIMEAFFMAWDTFLNMMCLVRRTNRMPVLGVSQSINKVMGIDDL